MCMKKVLIIFVTGASVLLTAIIVNIIATWMSLTTWYGFVEVVGEQGFLNGLEKADLASIVFLFLIYPFVLGIAGYYSSSYFKKLIKA